ncbi:MAG: NAD(P)/FAD-dependent oxidoreductase [Candidatus Eisenbacteria bacterium]
MIPDGRSMFDCDVLVIGGGAAGLFCAAVAGGRGRSVVVLERASRIGNKIRISGGGRCNFTNVNAGPENFVSENPHFCRSALARFTAADFVARIEGRGVAWHQEKKGQLFCDEGSREMIRFLEEECRDSGVRILVNVEIGADGIEKGDRFDVFTSLGVFRAPSVVIATGGLSIPKMGATPFGLEIAERFGHRIVPCRPALVPLLWNREDRETFGGLAGVSLDALVRLGAREFHDPILFTHRGLSGPAILQISTYRTGEEPIEIDLLPGRDLGEELLAARGRGADLGSFLAKRLPKRFAKIWVDAVLGPKPLARRSDAELGAIAARLKGWRIFPAGDEGYAKAEVTAGGVDTRELSSKTMESGKVPGLFFIGEVVDVTGWLGGYNFQWAWSSGFAAGQYA